MIEITEAVDRGDTVHWQDDGYIVTKDILSQYFIRGNFSGSFIGLTWNDGEEA